MTELTDEAVKALLDGATPGPWRADGEPWNRVVWSSADNRVCFMAHSNGLNDERDIATSNLAVAAPDLARTVIALHAEVAKLRRDLERRDEMHQCAMLERDDAINHWQEERAERDTLAADNQRLRDRDRVLADFIADFAAAKIDALRYQPAYGESPEDAPDPVVDAETVWAWQADARAALAKPAEKAGARC